MFCRSGGRFEFAPKQTAHLNNIMNILKFPEIRKKLIFTLFIIVAFRLLAHVPIPGVDVTALRQSLQNNVFLGLFDFFSGGGFQNFSLVSLGLGPYINISIIVQMLMVLIPSLEELSKEGESGREKLDMYTRVFSVPMALIQSFGIYFYLNKMGILGALNFFDLAVLMASLTVGSMILIWLGELVTEYGLGNGISLLIFVGIIGRLPISIAGFLGTMDSSNFFNMLLFVALSLLVIVGVVMVNEGTRNIILEYGRRDVKSQKVTNYLPLKVNQAGVIPIIFAVAVVMIPGALATPLQQIANPFLQNLGYFLSANFNDQSLGYNLFYFILVVGFTYFYTTVQFNPQKISDDIKKRGGFIPGIRPGTSTTKYLKGIVDRITLSGGLFLGVIAILPYLVQPFINVKNLGIGGTGLLIVVSVVLETIRKIESLTVTKGYKSYLE